MHLVSANRTGEPQRSLAANLALDAACHVDFDGLSLAPAIQRTLEAMLDILYSFERLLVTAVSRDIPAAELPAVAGVRPVRCGPEWVRCRNGYVNLAATRELWRKVSGTETADVYAVAVDGSLHRLAGYVYVPTDDRSIAELHRDFRSALGESTSVRAPD